MPDVGTIIRLHKTGEPHQSCIADCCDCGRGTTGCGTAARIVVLLTLNARCGCRQVHCIRLLREVNLLSRPDRLLQSCLRACG